MVHNSDDTSSYSKIMKDPTDFDDLPLYTRRSRFSSLHRWLVCILPWCISFCLGLILAYQYARSGPSNKIFPQALYSPAQSALEYEVRKFTSGFEGGHSKYQGPPSPELDDAWDALYNFNPQRITKAQAARLPNATAPIPGDEDHSIILIDVFHQLHCLNMIRKALNPVAYPEMAPDPHGGVDHLLGFSHIDHCVDNIRQSLMCSIDISPTVWRRDDRGKLRPDGKVVHTCRSWERVFEWAVENQIPGEINEDDFVVGRIVG